MKAIDVIVKSFNTLRENPIYFLPGLVFLLIFVILANIIIIPQIIALTNNLSSSGSTPTPAAMNAIQAFIPNLTFFTLITGLMAVYVYGVYCSLICGGEENKSIVNSLKSALFRFPQLTAFCIAAFLIQIAIISITLPITSAVALQGTPTSAPNLASQVPVGIFLIIELLIAPFLLAGGPMVVVEKKGVVASIKGSVRAGLSDYAGAFGVVAVFGVLFIILYTIIALFNSLSYTGGIIGQSISIISMLLLSFLLTFAFLVSPTYYASFVAVKQEPQPPAKLEKQGSSHRKTAK